MQGLFLPDILVYLLHRIRFTPKTSVLGSRDQLCVHSEVMKLEGNGAKTAGCAVRTKVCSWLNL